MFRPGRVTESRRSVPHRFTSTVEGASVSPNPAKLKPFSTPRNSGQCRNVFVYLRIGSGIVFSLP